MTEKMITFVEEFETKGTMVINILTLEQIRRLFVWVACSIMAIVAPTKGFVAALALAWAFNVWCGMRADGVINIKCRNWSWQKFSHALLELVAFLSVIWLVALITYNCGDAEAGLYACKTINYIFVWSCFENGLKNLCKAHPQTKALWIVYLFVRLEFTKMLRIDDIIRLYDEHIKKQENENNSSTDKSDNASRGGEHQG